jgi:CubicO group peptidase (beta-lactamase class C family)
MSLVMGCLFAISSHSAENVCAPPASIGDGWEISLPEQSSFDGEALCATLAAVASGEANIHGVVVERHGRLVAELYRKGSDRPINVLFGLGNPFSSDVDFGPTTLHDIRSVSKSMAGLLVGIAKEQGRITSLEVQE